MHVRERTSWLHAFMQPVTFLGIGMILTVMAGLAYLVQKDEDDAYRLAKRNGANLAQMFEGYLSRTLNSVDNTLRVLRTSYQQHSRTFDLAAWARDPDVQNDLTLQLSITGPDGVIRAS